MPLSPAPLSPRASRSRWYFDFPLAVAIVAAASLFRQAVDPLVHDQIPYFVYVASVVIATWFCGVVPALFSTILAAFAGNYLFVPPRYEVIPHGEDWIAMSLFAVVALGLVWLVGRWRRAEHDLYDYANQLQRQAEELRVLNAEAERVNRVKDEFLGTLSHELRTPMNAIVGWASMIHDGALRPRQVAEASETILRSARAQLHLIEDLLDVSRVVSGKLRLALGPVHLTDVVKSAVDIVHPAADAKGIVVETDLEGGVILTGDANRLGQAVWNLLSNAVKFTPKGGRVRVALEIRESQIELAVSDTGVGVEPEFLPHLFERFSQADSSISRTHGGLGLGLAIVRHIAELHGGSVSAESPGPDRGATFRISLPVRAIAEPAGREPPARASEPEYPKVPPFALRGVKVLIVDDEPDARELVEAVLRQYGAEVRTAASALEAFHEVRRWRPDVLVADIGMPGEDGYSLLRRVRALSAQEGGTTPAAALTAYAQREDRQRAFAAGFQEHVPKPVPPEQLAHVVARLARGDASRDRN